MQSGPRVAEVQFDSGKPESSVPRRDDRLPDVTRKINGEGIDY